MLLRLSFLLLCVGRLGLGLQDLLSALQGVDGASDDPACKYHGWSAFSECSCGSLTKYRTRSLKDAPTGPLAKWADNADCERIVSDEVACDITECQCVDVRRSGDCSDPSQGFCDNKNVGEARMGSPDWAWWVRRFCAKSCGLCQTPLVSPERVANAGGEESEEYSAEPEEESSAGGSSEAAGDGECVCGAWRTVQQCDKKMCGACGRKVELRECSSDNCWKRKETACEEGLQKKRCSRFGFKTAARAFESWPEEFGKTTRGCCTPTRFGPTCEPLSNPGK